jgi:pimeloyl-ACP methyl ester carboxylesterase
MPLIVLAFLVTQLFTAFLIWLEVYLWREWYLYKDVVGEPWDHDYAQRCLIGAIVVLVYLLLGKQILRLFMGKSRPGEDEPLAERCQQQQQLKMADGTEIHIEQCGAPGKQTIIFIHGWDSNSMQWYYQKKHFGKDYHLILMDLPGLGKSGKPAGNNYELEHLAECLKFVIEQTKPVNPILWGHSMGGFTILTFCKVYLQQLSTIKGIVLQHTTYTNPTKTSILSGLLTAIQNPVLKPICWLMVALSPVLWLSKWMSFINGNSLIMTRFLTFAGTQTYQQLNFASYLSTLASPAVTGRGVLAMFDYDALMTSLPNRWPASI